MRDSAPFLTRFGDLYDAWKNRIIYVLIILVLALWYLGPLFPDLRDRLLPAVTAMILAMLFETLRKLQTNISSMNKQREFSTVAEALPLFSEILANSRGKVRVEVVAVTGGSAVSAAIPKLMQVSYPSISELTVSLYVLNPNSQFSRWYPSHWIQETGMVVDRIKTELNMKWISARIYQYDSLPFLYGFMLDDRHLLLGFCRWRSVPGQTQIGGGDMPCRYIARHDPGADYYFELFRNWLDCGPHQLVFDSTSAKAVPVTEIKMPTA